MNASPGFLVCYEAGIVAHIRWLYFGDVQVSCHLGDKASVVLLEVERVLIEGPRIR